MIHPTHPDLLRVAERALGAPAVVRDHGLLEAALARPRTTVFGTDACPTLEEKVATLVHSVARDHGLVDGNERLALAATIAFLGVNGRRLTLSNDEAYELVVAVATGDLDDVGSIASRLSDASAAR